MWGRISYVSRISHVSENIVLEMFLNKLSCAVTVVAHLRGLVPT